MKFYLIPGGRRFHKHSCSLVTSYVGRHATAEYDSVKDATEHFADMIVLDDEHSRTPCLVCCKDA